MGFSENNTSMEASKSFVSVTPLSLASQLVEVSMDITGMKSNLENRMKLFDKDMLQIDAQLSDDYFIETGVCEVRTYQVVLLFLLKIS